MPYFVPLDSDAGCSLFVVIAIAAVIAVIVSNSSGHEKARRAYLEALQRLKTDPTNPNLREQTLAAGRRYSSISRNWRGVALFDEVAMMNDINAACAAASVPRVVQSSQTVEERLQRLGELKSQGLVDEREYEERRREILREL